MHFILPDIVYLLNKGDAIFVIFVLQHLNCIQLPANSEAH